MPEDVQHRTEWQIAAEMLIAAAKGQWPVMFADIAMRQALHAGKTKTTRRKPMAREYKIVR